MSQPFLRAVVIPLALVVFGGVDADAQLTTSAINGVVRDQTLAALPGATVTATNTETGRVRATTSSGQGSYRIDGLPPGAYTIRVELSGFRPKERRLQLGGTEVATVDVQLQIASAAEAIEVVAEAALVDVTQNQLKTQLDAQMMKEIPLNGRRFQDFALLAPGVGTDFGSTRSGSSDAISFFGFNERFKSLYVDGVDLNDELTGGGTGITDAPRAQFSMEAIQEITVLRNQFSAEVGRQQAGVINVITKSGTNDFRGNAFVFLRDDAVDKKNVFASGKLPFHQYQFGANLGGPIVKDKTHFFANVERWDAEQTATILIPPALVNFLADKRTEISQPYARTNVFLKLSHSLTDKNVLNVTYLYDRQQADNQAAVANAAADSRFTEKQNDNFLVARLTTTVGGRGVNELRLGYSRSFTDRPATSGRPNLNFAGFQSGTPTNMPQGRTQKNLIAANVFTRGFTWKGEHSFKVGGEVNIVRLPTKLNLFQFGQFTFARQEAPSATNPPIQYTLSRYSRPAADLNSNFYGVFIQDDWKVTPSLTVNLGLRYDLESYSGSYGGADWPTGLNSFEDKVRFLLSTAPGGANAATVYKSRETDRNNVQPRIGFNWAAGSDGRTSIRGGWGLFTEGGHDPISTQGTLKSDRAQSFVSVNPAVNASFFPNEPSAALLATFSRISLVSQFPGVFVESAYAHQFTFGAERQIGNDIGLAIDYAGIRSRHNGRDVNVNHPNASGACPFLASCAAVTVNMADGRMESDALQVQIRRSFARKVGFLVSYTLLKAELDGPSTSPLLRDADFGPMPNDVRHRFVASGNLRLPKDFDFGVVVNVASAFPYTATAGRDTTGDRVAGNDRSAGVTYNSLRGDGFFSADARLSKELRLGGNRRLELLAEAFNILNTVNYNNYNGVETSAIFRRATQALSPFQAQFGARFQF